MLVECHTVHIGFVGYLLHRDLVQLLPGQKLRQRIAESFAGFQGTAVDIFAHCITLLSGFVVSLFYHKCTFQYPVLFEPFKQSKLFYLFNCTINGSNPHFKGSDITVLVARGFFKILYQFTFIY